MPFFWPGSQEHSSNCPHSFFGKKKKNCVAYTSTHERIQWHFCLKKTYLMRSRLGTQSSQLVLCEAWNGMCLKSKQLASLASANGDTYWCQLFSWLSHPPRQEAWYKQNPALFPALLPLSQGQQTVAASFNSVSQILFTQDISSPVLLSPNKVPKLSGMVLVMGTVIFCYKRKESRWAVKETWTHGPLHGRNDGLRG